jgi:hypothetical protein
MQSSIKIILLFLAGLMLSIYAYGLSRGSDSKQLLIEGRIKIENEIITLSELLFQMRFFLLFVFGFSSLIWLLCFIHISKPLGITGVSIAFIDFIANFEVMGRVAQKPLTEAGVVHISRLFYLLALLNIGLYGALIVFTLI